MTNWDVGIKSKSSRQDCHVADEDIPASDSARMPADEDGGGKVQEGSGRWI